MSVSSKCMLKFPWTCTFGRDTSSRHGTIEVTGFIRAYIASFSYGTLTENSHSKSIALCWQ